MRAALYTRVSTKDKEKGDDSQTRKPRQTTANQLGPASRIRQLPGLEHRGRVRGPRIRQPGGSSPFSEPDARCRTAPVRCRVVLGARQVHEGRGTPDLAIPEPAFELRRRVSILHRTLPRLVRDVQGCGDSDSWHDCETGEGQAIRTS